MWIGADQFILVMKIITVPSFPEKEMVLAIAA
jgi:hypothetical protein